MSVGYHNTGHHNLGIKIPPKTQNTIRQPGQRSHPGAVPSSMLARPILCRPKAHEVQCHHLCLHAQILSRFQKAQYALGPRPNTGVRLVRGLPNRGTISASFETPLSRALRGASAQGETPPRSRSPSADWDCSPPAQRDRCIYYQPLHGMVRLSDGVSGHATQRT